MEARRTPSYNESLQQNQKHSSSSGILSFNNCKDVHAKKKKKRLTMHNQSTQLLNFTPTMRIEA